MSVKVTRNLNTDNVNFAAGTGTHDGHHQLQENALKFELIRCVSKLEMYFAKGAECGLTVNSIALQKEGICDWAYVTEPTEEMLKNIPHTFTNELTLLEEPAVIEKILLETDCPYMAPEPNRGKRNYSGYLPYVAERIAQIKQMTAQEVIDITNANARKLFGLSAVQD